MAKLKLLLITIITALHSCQKPDMDRKYIIFNSDSTHVFGILNLREINVNVPYEVFQGDRIIFCRHPETSGFNINADVGKYNYFDKDNYHYSLTNEYVITIH